jgi:hypothetical protein
MSSIPLPGGAKVISGTYTYSGKALVTYKTDSDAETDDWHNISVVNDDGSGWHEVFSGHIPVVGKANGIRWMCFPDNKRILLGDYVMECSPDIDHCVSVFLAPLSYPAELMQAQNVFCHWSEAIVSPDNSHICWTTLTMRGATNYLAKLVREESSYSLSDICIVSAARMYEPDPIHPGYMVPLPMRGGEVKQFIKGGTALTMVGSGDSISESVVQSLTSDELYQITNTPGYEETTIFSPDETLGVVMSPRFSAKTNCSVFGLVPQPHSLNTRSKLINMLYMYCVAGVRAFRKGSIGPVLIDIGKSRSGGRGYMGVDLSDPEGEWVYYSPMSWHPDSKRAMWVERTRPTGAGQRSRIRICRLPDRSAGAPIPAADTPCSEQIPYAVPFSVPADQEAGIKYPFNINGKHSGTVANNCTAAGEISTHETVYDNFSDDGDTFYNGRLSVTSAIHMFAPGDTVFEADLTVSGAHQGEMKLRALFKRDGVHAPSMLSFSIGKDGLPESRGWASYDGVALNVEDMEP